MEKRINLHIEKPPEGVYLATSEDLPGLVVQGDSVAETPEFARDAAWQLIEVQQEWARDAASPHADSGEPGAWLFTDQVETVFLTKPP